TRLVFRSDTTCGSPTTTMLESRVAMKIPTVVTVRTTHLYSKRKPPTTGSIFPADRKSQNINSGRPPRLRQNYSDHEFRTWYLSKRDFLISRSGLSRILATCKKSR